MTSETQPWKFLELRGFNGHVDRRLSEEYKDRQLGKRIKMVENSRLPNKSEIVLFCVTIIYHQQVWIGTPG